MKHGVSVRMNEVMASSHISHATQARYANIGVHGPLALRPTLDDARRAYEAGNRPVAALIVRDKPSSAVAAIPSMSTTIQARTRSRGYRVTCRELNTLELAGATLCCTLEPCPMCLWMILESKIERLVLGRAMPR
jgi:tRNA(adenine34) deaminase